MATDKINGKKIVNSKEEISRQTFLKIIKKLPEM